MKLFLTTIGICFFGSLQAQDLATHFRHLNSKNGLPSDFVRSFYKDSRGFLWIGSLNGLIRFDGKNVKNFMHHRNEPHSIINSDVTDMCEDPSGKLWIATSGGLSVMQPDQRFVNYKNLKQDTSHFNLAAGLSSIAYFKEHVYIGYIGGLIILNPKDFSYQVITAFPNQPKNGKKLNCIRDAMYVTKEGLWISTHTGMLFTADGKSFRHAGNNPQKLRLLDYGFVAAFTVTSEQKIAFMTWRFPGVYLYDPKSGKTDSFSIGEELDFSTISMMEIEKNKFWASTMGAGIAEIDIAKGSYKLIKSDPDLPGSLTSDGVNYVYRDDIGTLFVATANGIDYVHPSQCNFNQIKVNTTDNGPFPERTGYSLFQDVSGNLWASGFIRGMYKIDIYSGRVKFYPLTNGAGSITGISESEGKIMHSTDLGLGYFDPKSGQFSRAKIPEEINDIISNTITFTLRDKDRNYWMGIWQGGLLKLSPDMKKYQFYTLNDPHSILRHRTPIGGAIDDKNTLWITYSEITMITAIDLNNMKAEHFHTTAEENEIGGGSAALILLNDNLWLTTNTEGLICFNTRTHKTEHYNTSNIMPSDQMNFITVDSYKKLWIGSGSGLVCFDPAKRSAISYHYSDGLPGEYLIESDLTFINQDTAIFVCDRYLFQFQPGKMIANSHFPRLQFTSIKKSGTDIPILAGKNEIDLHHKDKSISFEFIGINFIDPDKNRYSYKLEGLDKGWTDLKDRTAINFTTLPPGEYTLMIACTNKAGIFNPQILKYIIRVHGPFWSTWWFISLVFLTLGGAAYIAYRIRLQRIYELQAIRDKISKDLHDDIGSALSSVSIYSEVAKTMSQQKLPELTTVLDNLQNTAKSAMENMGDIVWAINHKNDRFHNIIERLEIFANQILTAKGVRFLFEVPEDISLKTLTIQQRKNIYLICKEAINNVAKYAEAGECRLRISHENKNVVIRIEDNGKGIASQQPSMGGNGLLNMKKRAEELKGVLDIFSEKNKGTSLILTLSL